MKTYTREAYSQRRRYEQSQKGTKRRLIGLVGQNWWYVAYEDVSDSGGCLPDPGGSMILTRQSKTITETEEYLDS